jgi:acetyl-CoA acetyltransferase
MTDCYILGVGMTPFGRHLSRSLGDLTREAVEAAMKDAGVTRDDIEAIYFGNATQPHMESIKYVRGQVALRPLGFAGIPITNIENACCTGSTGVILACNEIKAGEADVVLVVGAEKMVSEDKAKSFALFASDYDINATRHMLALSLPYLKDFDAPPIDVKGSDKSVVMDAYAVITRMHMHRFGLTQRELAEVAAKNHRHSVHNPNAQYRESMTADDVLAARKLSWPLTVPMCAPVTDGAAAAVMCSEKVLKKLGRGRAIKIAASVLGGGTDRAVDDLEKQISRVAAFKAYSRAGIGPGDVSVAEVHDASAFGEVFQTEAIGLFPWGEGGKRGAAGESSLGGRVPVNVSGGLECRGHPIAATGLAQMHELVTQLRGEAGARQVEGAKVAVAENSGGIYGIEEAAAVVTVLQA